ncbi:MAG TPA: lysophospholipid acyltransferase family protein [Rectinemataceae bacterium]|nr:lysophospholipid acyltransferase family protein [Rectinemataceae bacterium]
MINILILTAIILSFVSYDIILRILIAVFPDKAQDILQHYALKAVRRIFSTVKAYGDFSLGLDDVSGQALPRRFLLVSNHQSLLDIPVLIHLLSSRRLRFVAKKELGGGLPFVSLLLRAQGQALIKRKGDAAQAMKALVRFAKRCRRDGTCPVVFPEGTRSRDGLIGEFYTAGVRRVLECESLPIVVAAIEGGWNVASIGSLVKNLRGTRYRVKILEILSAPKGKKEILEDVRRARELIVAEIAAMRGSPIGDVVSSAGKP